MFKKLFDPGYKELKRCEKIAEKVMALEPTYRAMSDDELKAKTLYFKEKVANGASLDDLLVEAYATAREAAYRVTGLLAFKVQVIGATAMHYGNIAEMKTGEGKTLTSVMVAYLNALSGKGVHIVTVNEYLASRDAHDMGAVHEWLGLTVGLNLRDMSSEEKQQQYACDITYSTNNELGFDYLRDHMVIHGEDMVQRPLNFAIIDEVDSILIDEARTPLIISGGEKRGPNLYIQANTFVKTLTKEEYDIDEKSKHITLNDAGAAHAEKFFNIPNLYDIKYVSLVHHINNALRANYIMAKDVDYVVKDNSVIIVDQFTGRLMYGRQFSEGLHQALEAKERVEIKKETRTLATITFQNYFRMYHKLAGMTGTAKTEEEEFRNIYNMFVVEVPTNAPVIRIDDPDKIYQTMDGKFKAIAKDIAERHAKGQPVLVGTISIETSELLSSLLKRRGIPHNVLNAKQHEREAEIVQHAGELGAVTIATNMAGRGTDIKLGEGVVALGGLAVIGTERHESRRIDNQLRGRSGRQGDPGYSVFYLSAEDDLLRRFGSERFKQMVRMGTGNEKDEEGNELPLQMKMLSRFIESAQRRVEGDNFDRRKSVVEYDEVLRKQREIIYKQRSDILFIDDMEPTVRNMMKETVDRILPQYFSNNHRKENNVTDFMKEFIMMYFNLGEFTEEDFEDVTLNEATEKVLNRLYKNLDDKKASCPSEIFREFLKVVLLRVVDKYWMDHIDQMSQLRQSVGLSSYAQLNPLREYQEIGFQLFNTMISNIQNEVTQLINRAQLRENLQREEVAKPTGTNAASDDTIKRKPIVKKEGKVGRNDPCPCGSGLKYKHCCGK